MHYPHNWIQKCWTSFPASDALWHQWKSHLFSSPCEISPCLLRGWLMLCHQCGDRSMLFAMTWWILTLSSSSATAEVEKKKKTRSVYEVCIQIWVLLPWQGICHEIRFPRWQRKVKGKDKRRRARRQSRERLTSSLNTLPDWGTGHHHFQSCSLTAVLSILKVRFH